MHFDAAPGELVQDFRNNSSGGFLPAGAFPEMRCRSHEGCKEHRKICMGTNRALRVVMIFPSSLPEENIVAVHAIAISGEMSGYTVAVFTDDKSKFLVWS